MKKTLALILLATLCIAVFIGCASTATGTADSGLTNARNYLFSMYKDKATVTAADFQRVAVLAISGVNYEVQWTATVSSGPQDGIQITSDGKVATIDVNEKTDQEIIYKLTATIIDPVNGGTVAVSFNHSVPAFKESSWAEYASASAGDSLVIKGVISGMMAKSKGNSSNCIYLQDADGGYYVYNLGSDPVADLGLEIGQTIRVTGAKDIYSGTYELMNSSVEVIDSAKTALVPADYTEIYAAAENLKDAALVEKQALLVTIKGVEVTGQDTASGYYKFKLGDLETYVRISSSVCPITKAEQTAFIAAHAEHLGWTANVTGVICVYDGAFYLSPVTADAFEYIALPAKDDASMVAFEKENLSLTSKVTEDSVFTLPTSGNGYSQVSISWASDNACAVVDGGKLTVTLPENDAVVNVTATISSNGASDTAVFQLAVDAAATDLFLTMPLTEPDPESGYPLVIHQANLGKTLFFSGEMNGNYLGTTDKADKAVLLFPEETEGGFYIYFMKDDVKNYVEIYEYTAGKVGVHITTEPTVPFTYSEELDTSVVNLLDTQYYLGTYKTYDTISASKTSYISGDNAANVGISQFPVRVEEIVPARFEIVNTTSPEIGKAYKFGLAQTNLGKMLYFSGEMSGNYLGTTDKVEKAADLFAEETEGGYFAYFMDGDTKTYVEVYEYTAGKVGVHLTTEPTVPFVWSTDAQVPVVKLLDTEYYLGTYKTYDTISASKTSYITGDNAANVGISQFPGHIYEVKLSPVYANLVTELIDGYPCKLSLTQANLGETLYFNGEISGNYLGTTDKLSKAVDVLPETVDGGFRLAFESAEGRKYIDVYETTAGKAGIRLTTEPTAVYNYDADAKTLVTKISDVDWYMGTYKTYNTMSASKTSYITGDNAANVGISQFPANLFTIDFLQL